MHHLNWIDPSISVRLTTVLLHFVWQGFLVGGVVIVAGMLLRKANAQSRYLVNVASLFIMLACLPVTYLLVDVPVNVPVEVTVRAEAELIGTDADSVDVPNADTSEESQVVSSEVEANSHLENSTFTGVPEEPNYALYVAPVVAGPTVVAESRSIFTVVEKTASFVTVLYFVCVAIMLARLAQGVWGGQRLRNNASPVDDEALLRKFDMQVQRIGLRFKPAIGWCEEISVPIVIGILRPMILLPATLASGLTPVQLQALMAHELAHVRRLDLFVNLLQRFIEALLFFHPAVWFVSRRVSVERELATDDFVLQAGWKRNHYADALVRMAELSSAFQVSRNGGKINSLAATGRHTSELKRRVLRILQADGTPRIRLSRGAFLAIAILLLSLLLIPMSSPELVSALAQNETESNANAEIEDVEERRDASFAEVVSDRFTKAISAQSLPFMGKEELDSFRKEMLDYLSSRIDSEPSADVQRRAIEAINERVRIYFHDESCYLSFRGEFNMLCWQLWTLAERRELSPEDLARREKQREWMRSYIRELPVTDRERSVEDWLPAGRIKNLETTVFANPLNPFFYEPMTDVVFEAFKLEIVKQQKGIKRGKIIHAPAHLFFAGVTVQEETLREKYPPGFTTGGLGMSGTKHFSFAAAMTTKNMTSVHLGEKTKDRRGYLDANRRIVVFQPKPLDVQTSARWLFDKGQGDIWFDNETRELKAVRGARLATIDETAWHAIDKVSSTELRNRLPTEVETSLSLSKLGPIITTEEDRATLKNFPTIVLQSEEGKIALIRIKDVHSDTLFLEIRTRPLPPNPPFHQGDINPVQDAADAKAEVNSDETSQLPSLRVEGDEVTLELIEKMTEREWGAVTLANAKFNGAMIERLRHVPSIRTLRLFGEGLSGQVARLKNINGLVALDIGTPLLVRDLESLGELTQLERLSLPKELALTVTGARQIAKLTNLKSLNLYNVDVDDASFVELKTLVKLEELYLGHTRITDEGLKTIVNMPNLRTLDLTRYRFTDQQLTDDCIASLLRLEKLEYLSISGKITDDSLRLIAKSPKLKTLSILFTEITADGMEGLEGSTVENLTISPGQTGSSPNWNGIQYLKKCKSLKNVFVSGQPTGDEDKWQQIHPDIGWGFHS